MKKYEIRKNCVEYRKINFAGYEPGMTIPDETESELIEVFDTLAEAEAELAKKKSSMWEQQGCPFDVVFVEEFVLMEWEVEYDDNLEEYEYIQGETLEVSEMSAD